MATQKKQHPACHWTTADNKTNGNNAKITNQNSLDTSSEIIHKKSLYYNFRHVNSDLWKGKLKQVSFQSLTL